MDWHDGACPDRRRERRGPRARGRRGCSPSRCRARRRAPATARRGLASLPRRVTRQPWRSHLGGPCQRGARAADLRRRGQRQGPTLAGRQLAAPDLFRGIVGLTLPRLRSFDFTLGPAWQLILHTDGVSARCDPDALPGGGPARPRDASGRSAAPVGPRHRRCHRGDRPAACLNPAIDARRPAGYRRYVAGRQRQGGAGTGGRSHDTVCVARARGCRPRPESAHYRRRGAGRRPAARDRLGPRRRRAPPPHAARGRLRRLRVLPRQLLQLRVVDAPFHGIPVFPNRNPPLLHLRASGPPYASRETSRASGSACAIESNTASLWVRGILQHYYGLDLARVAWVAQRAPTSVRLPAGVAMKVLPAGADLDALLVDGALDAMISPDVLPSLQRGDPAVGRLFEDSRGAEQEFYRRTRLFPISHLVILEDEVAGADPTVALCLLDLFRRARDACFSRLEEQQILALSWAGALLAEQRALMGPHYWPYNVPDNRLALETLLDFAHAQGVIPRPHSRGAVPARHARRPRCLSGYQPAPKPGPRLD